MQRSAMVARKVGWSRAIAFAAMLLMMFAFSACKRGEDGQGSATDAAASKPFDVRLGYFANLTHAQAVLGVASGEFAQAISPNTLSTKVFNAGPSLIEALFAGEIDIGYIGPGPALTAFEKSHGEGVRVIAGAAANGVVIVAGPDSGINTLADLKGKRIATPQMGNTQDIAARHYLIHELKQVNADNVLPVPNAEQSGMMSRGQIDAAWAPEPWAARLEAEAGGKVIAEEKDLWPDGEFTLTVIIVNPEFLAKHADIVEKMLGVHVQWTMRLQTNPTQQVAQLVEAMKSLTGKGLDPAIMERAISRVKFTNDPSQATFETMAQWAFDLGFSKLKPDLKSLIDTTILKKAVK